MQEERAARPATLLLLVFHNELGINISVVTCREVYESPLSVPNDFIEMHILVFLRIFPNLLEHVRAFALCYIDG